MGGGGPVACQGFLVRGLVSVFWWVELDLFSLECNEVSSSQFWGVYGFGMSSGSLYFNAQCYVPVLLERLASYVLLWNLLGLGWSLVSV